MINEGISQAILVSGESGVDKTESTKMLMLYLAYMGGRGAIEGRSVEQQVLEVRNHCIYVFEWRPTFIDNTPLIKALRMLEFLWYVSKS